MERLTRKKLGSSYPLKNDASAKVGLFTDYDGFFAFFEAVNRLGEIEDILGDDYDLSRLRDLVQADREGRCVIYPKEGVLNKGDRVWYVDIESGVLESGTVFIAEYKDGKLDSFSVNFDSGDFDEFLGVAWGDCILGSKKSAEEALKGQS